MWILKLPDVAVIVENHVAHRADGELDDLLTFISGAGDKCQEVVELAIRTVCDMILDDDGNVREL